MGLLRLLTQNEALLGRDVCMPVPSGHCVLGVPMQPPFPDGLQQVMFGMGCFWGAEKKFWQLSGVYTTAAGYAGGFTPNPLYEEVCSGLTGHNEVVRVVFDPYAISFTQLLTVFWQGHNPTLGMRQGNDVGTQYRSGIYYFGDDQLQAAAESAAQYQQALDQVGAGKITTEILAAPAFYFAEPYHQQYLAKNPGGYCPNISYQATGLPSFPS